MNPQTAFSRKWAQMNANFKAKIKTYFSDFLGFHLRKFALICG